VALLKLVEPARLDQSGSINAVCLPNAAHSLPVGSVCLAAGWGKLSTYVQQFTFDLIKTFLAFSFD